MPREYKRKPIEFEITQEGCFECVSHRRDKNGYAKAFWNLKDVSLHRYIFEECFGEIPESMVVRHKCDNPPCINPEHLELGTHKENMNDKVERGRSASKERNGRAKLTEGIVNEIRSSSESSYELSEKFSISISQIQKIRRYENWK